MNNSDSRSFGDTTRRFEQVKEYQRLYRLLEIFDRLFKSIYISFRTPLTYQNKYHVECIVFVQTRSNVVPPREYWIWSERNLNSMGHAEDAAISARDSLLAIEPSISYVPEWCHCRTGAPTRLCKSREKPEKQEKHEPNHKETFYVYLYWIRQWVICYFRSRMIVSTKFNASCVILIDEKLTEHWKMANILGRKMWNLINRIVDYSLVQLTCNI